MPRALLLALAVLLAAPLADAQVRFDVSAGGGTARALQGWEAPVPHLEVAVGARLGRVAVRARALDLLFDRPVVFEDGQPTRGDRDAFHSVAVDASYAVPVGPVSLSAGAGYRRLYEPRQRPQDAPFTAFYYAPVEAEVGLTPRLSTYARSDFNVVGLYNLSLDADRTQVGLRLTLGR